MANGLCKLCGKPRTKVHHKIHLTSNNVDDPNIVLRPDNLILFCKDCHYKERHRFGKHPSKCKFDKNGDLIKVSEENKC